MTPVHEEGVDYAVLEERISGVVHSMSDMKDEMRRGFDQIADKLDALDYVSRETHVAEIEILDNKIQYQAAAVSEQFKSMQRQHERYEARIRQTTALAVTALLGLLAVMATFIAGHS